MARALTFPGQGSQAVGMGKTLAEAFPAARELFEEVDEALKQPLSRLIWEGPEADLTLTENAQPALMAVSLAVMRVLEREGNFDWTGDNDLHSFLELCAELEMEVILRIGPFAHGECRNGGLPDWLYGRTFAVRSNDSGYLHYVAPVTGVVLVVIAGKWLALRAKVPSAAPMVDLAAKIDE